MVRKGRMVAARGKPEFNHVLSVMRLSIRAWPQVVRASNGTIARASRCGFWLPRGVRLDCAEAWRRARAAEWGSLLRSCPLCGGPQVQILSSPPRARSSTDRASDYGSEGWGFESLRARQYKDSALAYFLREKLIVFFDIGTVSNINCMKVLPNLGYGREVSGTSGWGADGNQFAIFVE